MNNLNWFVILALIRLSTSASLCLLSSTNPYSWVVSIRRAESKVIQCTGSLVAENYAIAPMTCFQEHPARGFYEGKKFVVVSGEETLGNCRQERRGKLVMGHPGLAKDRYQFNIAYLEVEPFYFDPATPPFMVLPDTEEANVEVLKKEGAKCTAVWVTSDPTGVDYGVNALSIVDTQMITRSKCWHDYCPTGNIGCVAYFWESETYACATVTDREKQCLQESIGAPFICNGSTVGMLKSCWTPKPLMIQGFNQAQLQGIDMYRRIVARKGEVEPDGVQQEEPSFQLYSDTEYDVHP